MVEGAQEAGINISEINGKSNVYKDDDAPGENLALWLSKLPLREDEEAARVVHGQLADWLEQGNPHLLANRPRVLEIVAQLREKKSAELTSSSTLARLGRFA